MKVAAGCLCAMFAALAAGCGGGTTTSSLGASCTEGTEKAAPNVCVDPSNPKATQVADLVAKLRTQYKLNASIFGVWNGDDQLVTGADGEALPSVPATRDLHFRICNVTESMTTTLLLQYVDEGKLSLDDPVSKWFPSVPRSDQVTLGMLAASTSGIVDYVTTKSFLNEFYKNPFKQLQPQQLIQIGTSQKPLFAPGTSWAFSDTNFMLLGEILKKAEGKPLGIQLRDKILDPLGLDNTAMQPTAQVPFPTLHGYTPERGKYEDSTFWSPSWATNTGNMTSDLADLGTWIPVLGTGSLLSEESHESQVGPANVGKGGLTKGRYYGKGVGVARSWVLTNPHCAGYNGLVAYYPPKELSVVIFSTPGIGNDDGPNYSQYIFVEVTKILTPDSVPKLPQRVD
jgi:D-alanyl-D-alanine carboxypeptidase